MADKKAKKDDKKKGPITSPKKQYIDREEAESKVFPKFVVGALEPDTLIILLASKEHEVLIRTLYHLTKFAEKHQDNAASLYKLQIIQKILENGLWTHEILHIKRFAMKIFAALTELENEVFDDRLIEKFYSIAQNTYSDSMDSFMVEYAAVILFNLLREPRIISELENNIAFMTTVFKHIATRKDVDILHYSYKILIKLFTTASSVLQFCDIQTFPFERVLGDISSEYPEIQEDALNVFAEVAVCRTEIYETKFICPIFFEELFKVLENDLWQDRHLAIIQVLRRLMNNQNFAKIFCRNDYLLRYVSYVKNKDLYKLQALGVLVEVAQFEEHLETLFLLSVLTTLLEFLKDLKAVNVDVCVGIKRMLRHIESFNKIVNDDPAPQLLNIIKTDSKDWDLRDAAAHTLRDILNRSHKSCESALKNEVGRVIGHIFQQPFGEAPIDSLLNLLNVLITMAKDPEIRQKVMDGALPQDFVQAIKKNMRSAILTANFFNCAIAFICEESLQKEFFSNDLSNIVLTGLKSLAVVVKNAAADFIVVTGKILEFAEEYIDSGVLQYLLEDDNALSSCSSWSPAIESILSNSMSFKFLLRGRLEITDMTGVDFSVSKHHWEDYKILRSIQQEEVSPFYPLILVNFNHTEAEEHAVRRFQFVCHSGEMDGDDIHSDDSEIREWSYCRRPADIRLPQYLEQLRQELEVRGLVDSSKVPNCIDITKIADRAKTIAEIVHNEMCGAHEYEKPLPCSDTAVLNHLNELKCQLHCNIIPLGLIRYGAHFERAILFKALADQIGLPATLVRGIEGRILYNEIPIPEQTEVCMYALVAEHLQTWPNFYEFVKDSCISVLSLFTNK